MRSPEERKARAAKRYHLYAHLPGVGPRLRWRKATPVGEVGVSSVPTLCGREVSHTTTRENFDKEWARGNGLFCPFCAEARP